MHELTITVEDDSYKILKPLVDQHTVGPLLYEFIHSITVWDRELTGFMYKLNHSKKSVNPSGLREFNETLKDTVKRLKNEVPNYSYFLTDYGINKKDGTTAHLFNGARLLYGKIQDGTSLTDWLTQAVEGKTSDVGGFL